MTEQIDDGGLAFPVSNGLDTAYGMSLRDWFAGQALAGLCANVEWQSAASWKGKDVPAAMADGAYHYADAMIAASKVTS